MFGRGTQAELLAYFFDRDTSPRFKTPARCLHSGDESRIVLKLIIKPIILVFKTDQNSGWPAMPRHKDFLVRCKLNVA
jgi:hypothetical protein